MRKTLTIVTLLSLLVLPCHSLAGERAPHPALPGVHGSFLGVELSNLDDDAAAELGLRGPAGVRIDRVIEDSAAAEAGLEDGDVVLAFDGERVRSSSQLGRLVRETAPGRTVELTVQRDGRERVVEVRLRERSSPSSFFVPLAPMPGMPAMPKMPPMPALAPLAQDAYRNVLRFAGGASWRLGIQGGDLKGQLAEFFEVDQGDGVLVEAVIEGSAAEKAGLRPGDVIVGIDDERVHSLSGLRALLANADRDAAGSVIVVRKGRERSLPVELEKLDRQGALGFVGDEGALRELKERHAAQAEEWAEQAEHWRAQQHELKREFEEHARELREQGRELRQRQRELQHRLRDAGRGSRFATPAPAAAPMPAPSPARRVPTGSPL
jgi:C-terminal processing protease CtpA/Prc